MPEVENSKSVITLGTENEIIEKENIPKIESDNKKSLMSSELNISFLLAFVECNFEQVSRILSKDPTLVNMKNPFDGNTALHFASKFGDIAIIRLLAGNFDADVNIINHSGKTPLHYAAEFSKHEAASILISNYNAKKDIRDYNGKLPLDWVTPELFEVMGKLLGTSRVQEIVKEEKVSVQRLSTKVNTKLRSFLVSDSSSKTSKSSHATVGGDYPRIMTSSTSADMIKKMNHLSLSQADIDKIHIKKPLTPKLDKLSAKYSIVGQRGSFSGRIN